MDKVQQKIISDVLEERERQNTKWGEQNHFVDKWGNIIGRNLPIRLACGPDF